MRRCKRLTQRGQLGLVSMLFHSGSRPRRIAEYLFERCRPSLLLVHTQASNQVPQEPGWFNPRRGRANATSVRTTDLVER